MSLAVLSCFEFGRPEALRNTVRVMPSSLALRVIIWANLLSLPPSASAMTTATSLADLVTRARIASLTAMLEPRLSRSLEGGIEAARLETGRR